MRSIYLFPHINLEGACELLTTLGRRNEGSLEWVIGGCLYVSIIDPPYWGDWDPEDVRHIEACFGGEPGVMIGVDVSGRVPGNSEVQQLCEAVLNGGGAASDDYSDCWDLDEIRHSTRDGRPFFEPPPMTCPPSRGNRRSRTVSPHENLR